MYLYLSFYAHSISPWLPCRRVRGLAGLQSLQEALEAHRASAGLQGLFGIRFCGFWRPARRPWRPERPPQASWASLEFIFVGSGGPHGPCEPPGPPGPPWIFSLYILEARTAFGCLRGTPWLGVSLQLITNTRPIHHQSITNKSSNLVRTAPTHRQPVAKVTSTTHHEGIIPVCQRHSWWFVPARPATRRKRMPRSCTGLWDVYAKSGQIMGQFPDKLLCGL